VTAAAPPALPRRRGRIGAAGATTRSTRLGFGVHHRDVRTRSFVVSGAPLAAVLAVGSLLGCEPPPPIKTSTGERIDSVTYEEKFARTTDTHEGSFRGDRLRKALELMEKRGLLEREGTYAAAGVVDTSTLTIVVKSAAKERRIELRNCAEEHVCGFFADAQSQGVVEKQPVVCKSGKVCDAKK